jgi:20S proteasome alpha/beta subunit
VESLTQALCDLALSFGEGSEGNKSKMSRPFGVALLLAGVDSRGCQLYHMDPSGTYTKYDAQAIGNGSEAARTILLERYNKSLSLADAAALVVRVLSETMEEKVGAVWSWGMMWRLHTDRVHSSFTSLFFTRTSGEHQQRGDCNGCSGARLHAHGAV